MDAKAIIQKDGAKEEEKEIKWNQKTSSWEQRAEREKSFGLHRVGDCQSGARVLFSALIEKLFCFSSCAAVTTHTPKVDFVVLPK